MSTISAQLHDGLTAASQSAELEFLNASLGVRVDNEENWYMQSSVRISARMGEQIRLIYLPDGSQLACPDSVELDGLIARDRSEGLVSWLDARWWVALLAVAVTTLSLLLGYSIGLPWLAERVSARVSLEQEQRLGAQALKVLDSSGYFGVSQLTFDQRQEASRTFERMRKHVAGLTGARLEFRYAPGVGPNAFALPGGAVVVTDELISLCESQDELAGILGHELGHLEQHHTIRSVIQNAGIAVASGVILGDVSSVVVFASFPSVLATLKYSRAMETEADSYSMALLFSKGIATENYARILERLRDQPKIRKAKEFSYLSSHPDTQLRIDRVRQFGKQRG